MSKNTSETYNGWLSANPQKRLGEVFFLRVSISLLSNLKTQHLRFFLQ